MAKLAITISAQGIQTLSFFGNTEEERKIGLRLYAILEEELRVIDRLVKQTLLAALVRKIKKRTEIRANKKLKVTYRPLDHSKQVVSNLIKMLAKKALQKWSSPRKLGQVK